VGLENVRGTEIKGSERELSPFVGADRRVTIEKLKNAKSYLVITLNGEGIGSTHYYASEKEASLFMEAIMKWSLSVSRLAEMRDGDV